MREHWLLTEKQQSLDRLTDRQRDRERERQIHMKWLWERPAYSVSWWHDVQLSACWYENVSRGHCVHTAEPTVLYVPGSHDVHSDVYATPKHTHRHTYRHMHRHMHTVTDVCKTSTHQRDKWLPSAYLWSLSAVSWLQHSLSWKPHPTVNHRPAMRECSLQPWVSLTSDASHQAQCSRGDCDGQHCVGTHNGHSQPYTRTHTDTVLTRRLWRTALVDSHHQHTALESAMSRPSVSADTHTDTHGLTMVILNPTHA